jgi:cytochrome P450
MSTRIDELPSPAGLPVLGNLHQLKPGRLHQILEDWANALGPIYAFRFGPRTALALSDRKLIEDVLRDRPEPWRRLSSVESVFEELAIPGVFSAEGAAWRAQRRLATEALSYHRLKAFYPTLRAAAGKLRKRWASRPAGEAVDIGDDFKRFTVDVTSHLALGHDVNTLEREDDPIHRRIENVFPAINRRLNALVPYWRWLRLPADRQVDADIAALRPWLARLIEEARKKLAAEPSHEPENLLEAMIAARDERGLPYGDEVIFGNAITMLLAGEDTTANTLAWAVHELCDRPRAVTELRRELHDVLGTDPIPAEETTVNQLSYAGAIANEAMRLRPVAPIIFLEATRDTTLGNVMVAKGTPVFVLTRPPAMCPYAFGEPHEFSPERWLRPPAVHEPRAHLPFGSGPRICPGRSLALLELRLVLATLYQGFEVTRAVPAAAVREEFSFTMFPAGLRVFLRPRA